MNKNTLSLGLSVLTVFALTISSCQRPPTKKKAAAVAGGACNEDYAKKVSELKARVANIDKASKQEKDTEKVKSLESAQDAQCRDVLANYEKSATGFCNVAATKEQITSESVIDLCQATVAAKQKEADKASQADFNATADVCHSSVVDLAATANKEGAELKELKKEKKDTKQILKSLYSTCESLISKIETGTKCRLNDQKTVLTYEKVATQCETIKKELEAIEKKKLPDLNPAKQGDGAPVIQEEVDAAKVAEAKRLEAAKQADAAKKLSEEVAAFEQIIDKDRIERIKRVIFLSDSSLKEVLKDTADENVDGSVSHFNNHPAVVVVYKRFFNQDGSKKADDVIQAELDKIAATVAERAKAAAAAAAEK